VPPEGGGSGAERSGVGPFRESMRDHVGGEGENREVVGTTQTEEGALHVCFDGVREGSVGVRESDVE